MMNTTTLIGPFSQLLTMADLPEKGPIKDSQLQIIEDGCIAVKNGHIEAIGIYRYLKDQYPNKIHIDNPAVAIPGLIDCHTHLVFAGSRAADYALRVSGHSYPEIAKRGGGILDTVAKTRAASKNDLIVSSQLRCQRLLKLGITTCEVKSGYGLSIDEEVKILETVRELNQLQPIDLIPTCLAAHTRPSEFSNNKEYLRHIVDGLFPILKEQKLCNRIDIFVDEMAFNVDEARDYLLSAQRYGFSICVHADQFKRGGSQLAAELKAVSADHLENSTVEDYLALVHSNVVAVALPGASIGLGIPHPAVRKMLDKGLTVAIASDWNPGSAPMGNLLAEASILGASEHLTMTETLAGITIRGAKALRLFDRGSLEIDQRADIAVFNCSDYREILYNQGSFIPSEIFILGKKHL